MRNRDYWQAKLERAQKELAVLMDKLANGPPKMFVACRRDRTPRRLRAFARVQKRYFSMRRRAKMLESKIPFYKEMIRACTLTKWDRLLAD